jgi:hypothetical protein
VQQAPTKSVDAGDNAEPPLEPVEWKPLGLALPQLVFLQLQESTGLRSWRGRLRMLADERPRSLVAMGYGREGVYSG